MKALSNALLAGITTMTMAPAAMAQQKPTVVSAMGSGIPVPLEVPDGASFILFGPHWGQKATVTGGRVPTPPPGSYGNFQLPSGSWYPVSVTPPGWRGTIMGGRCNGSCPAGVDQRTFALIAP
jgi:hypothetical protein